MALPRRVVMMMELESAVYRLVQWGRRSKPLSKKSKMSKMKRT